MQKQIEAIQSKLDTMVALSNETDHVTAHVRNRYMSAQLRLIESDVADIRIGVDGDKQRTMNESTFAYVTQQESKKPKDLGQGLQHVLAQYQSHATENNALAKNYVVRVVGDKLSIVYGVNTTIASIKISNVVDMDRCKQRLVNELEE